MAYQRILTIQDISCLGQCSMTVALPILSACGHEVCILPTKVLSTHTGGFQDPYVADLTESVPHIQDHWRREGIAFDVIYTGYLGSRRAISHVSRLADTMLAPGGMLIVDPAMADHGKLYKGFDEDYARDMAALCARADVILPNVTEAAMLAGLPYRENPDREYILQLLENLGNRNVVLTGAGTEPETTAVAIKEKTEISLYRHKKIPQNYHGTGDVFAAALTGALASRKNLANAAGIAAEFTLKAIENTYRAPAHWYGVKFETALPELIRLLNDKTAVD